MMWSAFARWWLYLGAALVVGDATLQLAHVPRPATVTHRVSRLALFGWWAMALALTLLFVVQAYAMELSPTLTDVRVVLTETTWGRGWSVLVLCVAGGIVANVLRAPMWFRAVCACAAAIAMGGVGHAAADEAWPLLARTLDAVHVLSAGAWIGGLLLLATDTRSDRATWAAFSRVATLAAPLVVVSGIGVTLRRLWGVPLHDTLSSSYAQLLALKVALVFVLLGFGVAHRRRVAARLTPGTRSIRNEIFFALAVFVVTSVLTGSAPPGE